ELGRVLAVLREAERLTRSLDDPRRLGWLSLYMGAHLWLIGDSEAARFTRSARTIAETLHDRPLLVWSQYYLGLTSFAERDCRPAADLLRGLVQELDGNLARDRLGMAGFPSVCARAWLVRALAELGEFAKGATHGEQGVALGEELGQAYSLIFMCWHRAHLE